ncbi:HAMP domain-containing sensor histidine kinase [Clostridium sp. Ade.TY]|uniref:sensor histidine kinase n=1 Tax=Clostridium sp. Ade.TY TaxID=1391647 RepID=UPI0012698313|nr:HAMP domain-containing sensor histidine kinase [Clostridium sp. Ade.TY]
MFFLLVIILVLIIILTLLVKNIKALRFDVKKLNNRNTNELLKVKYPSLELEKLIVEINKNIILRKETEEKYRCMDLELRQAIANISHDLRTPLTSIIGYVQLLKDDNVDKQLKEEYLNIIEKRSIVLKNLISSFYDLSRLQANEYDLDIEKVNLNNILCEIIAAFYEEISSKGIEPNINIDENLCKVYGDVKAINRIFTNLIQNILKYAKDSVSISLEKEGDYIITKFSNSTSEIEEIDVDRIFERFFTVDRMRTGQNTGLGLAITKILVEKQGHKIWAEKDEKLGVLSIIIKWKII